MPAPPSLILRSCDFEASGLDSRSLRRATERGTMARVLPGAYVNASTWAALSAREQYVTRIHASVVRLRGPVVVSHWSAAAVWGFPVPDDWPREVQIVDPARSTTNRIPSLLRRPGVVRSGDRIDWEGIAVTTPSRTAADLALTSPFDEAVMVFDHGLRVGLFAKEEVAEHLARRPDARRSKSAHAALDFATPLAQWPGESFSRVGMLTRGFEMPSLQVPFYDEWGKIGDADFGWRSVLALGEFDGQWKYTDPRFMAGRTAPEVIRDEKRRHARLAAHPDVRTIIRWDYSVARNPDELARRLIAGGVPRLNPRDRRSRRS